LHFVGASICLFVYLSRILAHIAPPTGISCINSRSRIEDLKSIKL
jgi:hypothetical protein